VENVPKKRRRTANVEPRYFALKTIPQPNQPASQQSRQRSSFIEKSLADVSHTLEQTLFAEKIAQENGLLQRRDARIKILALILLLLAVGLSHNLAIILGLYLLLLGLAWASAVPMGFYIKRVWLFMPFFTGIVAIPALFITPGPALWHLPLGLVVTQSGLNSALFLLLRVGTSVSAAVLLVLSTPWNTVLKALGVLRLPDVVVLILGMTYRYIYLLLHTANDMFLSRRSRILRRLDGASERRLVAASAGTLLSRSLQLSSEVYLAMQSRGFQGTPRTMDTFKMGSGDWVFAVTTLIISAAAIWLGH
jgi:cobalt/nickel transport system permease protein